MKAKRILSFIGLIVLFGLAITLINKQRGEFYKETTIVKLIAKEISCDFENRHLYIDSTSSEKPFSGFKGKIVLPVFRDIVLDSAAAMDSRFSEIMDLDTLHLNIYYIKGKLSRRPHDLDMDFGCRGAHSLSVEEILRIEKK